PIATTLLTNEFISSAPHQTGGPHREDHNHRQKDREQRQLRKPGIPEIVGESNEQARPESALDAAEPAHGHDHEGEEHDLEVRARKDTEQRTTQHPTEAGEAGAERKYAGEQQRHVDPDATQHFLDREACANGRADFRVLEKQPEQQRKRKTDGDQEQPVGGIGNAEKLDGTAEQRRLRQHHGIAAPYPERRVGEDEKQAKRQQRLRQLLLVKLGQEHALDAHTQRRDQHEADDRSQDEIAAPLHHAERDVSAQQVK